MFEAVETTGVEQDNNLSITHMAGLVAMLLFLVFNHKFFLLQRKFLAKIIGHTIHLCNFRFWNHSGNRFNAIIQHYNLIILLIYS